MNNTNTNNDTVQSDSYNQRLVEQAPRAAPAGWFDAAIPLDPRVNVVITRKDHINYLTGFDSELPGTVLSILDSAAGHEATEHAAYVETYEGARQVFAGLVESQCLIETFVDIYYQSDSEFVQFEPVEIGGRSNHYQTPSVVGLFVSRYTATIGCGEQHDRTDSDTDSVSGSEISQDTLLAYFSHWLNNYTCKSLSDTPSPETMLSSVDGLEKVSRGDSQGDSQYYWQLDERVWDFE
jgi:hypothetical protein